LVMVYHPWLGGMLSEQAASHWVTVAHQHGFVVAFLEGMSDFTNPDGAEDDSLRGWNCGHLPGDCSANELFDSTLRLRQTTADALNHAAKHATPIHAFGRPVKMMVCSRWLYLTISRTLCALTQAESMVQAILTVV